MTRDPIETVEPVVAVYRLGLIGYGNSEDEANADLEAQIGEIRERHSLRHPFEACGCIYCRQSI